MSTPSQSQENSNPLSESLREAWVIINPASGGGKTGNAIEDIDIAAKKRGFRWNLRVATRRGHAEELAVRAVSQEIPMVISVGGDGTLHEVANGLMRGDPDQRPPLAVLPMGTGNDFAKMMGIPLGLEEGIQAIAQGTIRPFDVGAAGDRYFVNDLGTGLFSEATRRFNRLPGCVPGPLRYVSAAVLTALRRYRASVRLILDDEERFNGGFSVLSVSNAEWSGGRFRLNPGGSIFDGALDVTVAGPQPVGAAMSRIPRLLAGTHRSLEDVTSWEARSIRIESEEIEHFQLDGELYGFPAEGLDIDLEPLALRGVFGPGKKSAE